MTGKSTYFVTISTPGKRALFQTARMADLLLDVLFHYRSQQKYLLHEFVIMPDHGHLLVTPAETSTLEKTVQFIKGSFSHRAHKELGFIGDIWQPSFIDRRVRELTDYRGFAEYIHQNPVRRGLVTKAEDYPYSSATGKFVLDDVPQRLKPISRATSTQA